MRLLACCPTHFFCLVKPTGYRKDDASQGRLHATAPQQDQSAIRHCIPFVRADRVHPATQMQSPRKQRHRKTAGFSAAHLLTHCRSIQKSKSKVQSFRLSVCRVLDHVCAWHQGNVVQVSHDSLLAAHATATPTPTRPTQVDIRYPISNSSKSSPFHPPLSRSIGFLQEDKTKFRRLFLSDFTTLLKERKFRRLFLSEFATLLKERKKATE